MTRTSPSETYGADQDYAAYYHVVSAGWSEGDDLLCWDILADRGIVSESDWRWEDAPVGYDGHLIALHGTLDQAVEHLALFGGARILRVWLHRREVSRNAEGYPCTMRQVDADRIEIIA